jgi:hypothetical protein
MLRLQAALTVPLELHKPNKIQKLVGAASTSRYSGWPQNVKAINAGATWPHGPRRHRHSVASKGIGVFLRLVAFGLGTMLAVARC